jgi:high-affinity iron transporter
LSFRTKSIASALVVAAAACADAIDAAPKDASAPDSATTFRPPPAGESDSCESADASDVIPPDRFAGWVNPLASDPNAVAAGKSAFAERCAFCHGKSGKGDAPDRPRDPPPPDLTVARRSDAYLLWRITLGGREAPFCSGMPAFENLLAERQRWQLVAFFQTFPVSLDAGGAADAADQ